MLNNNWSATLGLSATPERDYDDNFYVIIKILGDIIFEYDYIDARDDEVIVNFSLLYAYAPLLKEEEKNMKTLVNLSEKGLPQFMSQYGRLST